MSLLSSVRGHGDPASDLPGVLLALDAELVATGPGGERRIAAADFFTGVFETALGPQDVLTEIRVPVYGTAFTLALVERRLAEVGLRAQPRERAGRG